jgi:phage major head subunit gpT-like protein
MSHDSARGVTTLRGLTQAFDNAIRAAQPFYPSLAMTVQSTGADEEYGLLGRVPAVRQFLGERKFKTLRAAKWTIENLEWETSLPILRTDYNDDRLGMYRPSVAQMGVRAAKHPDKLLFTLMNDGETGEAFDGQNFFDTDHSWGDSGTQDNDLTYSVSDVTAITAAEIKAAYNAAVTAMAGFQDDQGELINDDIVDESESLTVVVSPALLQATHDALTVRLASGGGDNYVVKRPRIIGSARFSATTKMDVYKTDEPFKPFIFQAREPIRRQIKDMNDIEEKFIKLMTYARYNVGYGAWWTAVRTTFS